MKFHEFLKGLVFRRPHMIEDGDPDIIGISFTDKDYPGVKKDGIPEFAWIDKNGEEVGSYGTLTFEDLIADDWEILAEIMILKTWRPKKNFKITTTFFD